MANFIDPGQLIDKYQRLKRATSKGFTGFMVKRRFLCIGR